MLNVVQISDWHLYQRDGEQFLQTSRGAHAKNRKSFSPEAIYNLTCMGIEKLIMAFLMKRGDLAENHTMGDLLYALERHLDNTAEVAEDLRYLDSFQEICDLESYVVNIPTPEDLTRIVSCGRHIQDFLSPHLP